MPRAEAAGPQHGSSGGLSLASSQTEQLLTLLRSNQHPSKHPEIGEEDVKELLGRARVDLQNCDVSVADLETQLRIRHQEQADLQLRVAGYQSLFAPIRKLPPECLRLIFILYCSDGGNVLHVGGQTRIPALTLTSVCSHWRSVALLAVQLWSKLAIVLGRTTNAVYARGLNVVDLVLSRSNSAPLTLSYTELEGILPFKDERRFIFRLLTNQSHRWWRISIFPWSFESVEVIAECFGVLGALPLLEYLEVDWVTDLDLPLFQHSPKLLTAKLHFVNLNRVQLPWSQIRSFTAKSCSLDQICNSMSKFHNLEVLSIDSPEEFDEDMSAALVPWSSTVQSLSIVAETRDLRTLLSNATIGSLTTLSITLAADSDEDLPHEEFINFLTRSHCALTTLAMVNVVLPQNSLIKIFRLVPEVTDLTFKVGSDWPVEVPFSTNHLMLEMRAYSSYSSCNLLPNLQTLTLALDTVSEDLFVDMVESRWRLHQHADDMPVCMRSVTLELKMGTFSSSFIKAPPRGLEMIVRNISAAGE